MRQWATRKKVCLPKHNYKLDNNLLTVELRAVVRIVLMRMRIRIQLKILMLIRIQIQIRRGGGRSAKMCIPLGKILGTPLPKGLRQN
jgi:hypothetical protein